LAQFLGDEYYQKVIKNDNLVENILTKSSVKYMKSEFGFYVRKGEVGDGEII